MKDDNKVKELLQDEEDQDMKKPIYHILPITIDADI